MKLKIYIRRDYLVIKYENTTYRLIVIAPLVLTPTLVGVG
jgi:hypothetical protein